MSSRTHLSLFASRRFSFVKLVNSFRHEGGTWASPPFALVHHWSRVPYKSTPNHTTVHIEKNSLHWRLCHWPSWSELTTFVNIHIAQWVCFSRRSLITTLSNRSISRVARRYRRCPVWSKLVLFADTTSCPIWSSTHPNDDTIICPNWSVTSYSDVIISSQFDQHQPHWRCLH